MYDKYLNIIMDILVQYEYLKMAPRLFQLTVNSLSRVLNFVSSRNERVRGNSYSATKTWHERKSEIPNDMLIQIYHYSKQNDLINLERKIEDLV